MLTREQINALEPGSEADAAVAEFVMGWEWFMYDVDLDQRGRILRPRNCPEEGPTWKQVSSPRSVVDNMYYVDRKPCSTDYAAAMEVAMQIRKDGCEWTLESYSDYFRMTFLDHDGNDVEVDSETPQLAICKAALLRALENQEKESDH